MSLINTNYSQAISSGLSYLMGSSTSSGSGSSSDSSDNSLLNLLKKVGGMRDYDLPKDSSGKSYVVTISDMNKATSSTSKLSLASEVSETVLMQADAAAKTENASRVVDITDQVQSVLTAVSGAVDDLTSGETTTAETQKTLSPYQNTISATLNNLHESLAEVKNLLSKASKTDKSSVETLLATLDQTASGIAAKAGVSWSSVTGNADYTVSGYSAASSTASSSSSSSTSLVDLLA